MRAASLYSVGKRFEQLDDLVLLACGQELMTRCALPKTDWAQKIFRYELVGAASGFATVAWTPFGMISANLVLSGSVAFMGILVEKVAGRSYKEKRSAVMQYTLYEL